MATHPFFQRGGFVFRPRVPFYTATSLTENTAVALITPAAGDKAMVFYIGYSNDGDANQVSLSYSTDTSPSDWRFCETLPYGGTALHNLLGAEWEGPLSATLYLSAATTGGAVHVTVGYLSRL